MKYSEYEAKYGPTDAEIQRMMQEFADKEAANRRSIRQQEAGRLMARTQRKVIDLLMAKRGLTEVEASNWLHNYESLEAAVRAENEQEQKRREAIAEQEAAIIGASPWLASAANTTERKVETKLAPWAIKMDEGTARISGLASPFGGSSDSYGDIVEPGAYRATIAEAQARGQKYLWPLLWSHDPQRPIGGVLDARELPDGLHVEAQIAVDTAVGKDAYSLIQKGMVPGLSIGYIARKDCYVGKTRHLLAIDLLEISAVVTFPAAPAARVTGTGR